MNMPAPAVANWPHLLQQLYWYILFKSLMGLSESHSLIFNCVMPVPRQKGNILQTENCHCQSIVLQLMSKEMLHWVNIVPAEETIFVEISKKRTIKS